MSTKTVEQEYIAKLERKLALARKRSESKSEKPPSKSRKVEESDSDSDSETDGYESECEECGKDEANCNCEWWTCCDDKFVHNADKCPDCARWRCDCKDHCFKRKTTMSCVKCKATRASRK